MRFGPVFALLALGSIALAGCVTQQSDDVERATIVAPEIPDLVPVIVDQVMTFEKSVVDAAVAFSNDLYEPTIDVSKSGTIYIAGHTILVDTTGAPAFFSTDDGATWRQLPFLGPAAMPGPVHGATPPPSDEIFIVAGDDGWAYGVDITAATYPVNAWSGDGAMHAYHNPNAYNRADWATQACQLVSLNDRPFAAYAAGSLLMVNNPGGGYAQIGVMDVPPAMPVGAGAPMVGVTWNTCAGPGNGYIPGLPAMREDGLFLVPQVLRKGSVLEDDQLIVVKGNKADVFAVETVDVTSFSTMGSVTSNYGFAAVDAEGRFFVGIVNNTVKELDCPGGAAGPCYEADSGQFRLAAYDEAQNEFRPRTFATEGVVRHLYLDGNMAGAGALVVWAVEGEDEDRADWFVAHTRVGADGAPVLENVALAIDEGPPPSAHITGAALGPDGRAYLAMYERASQPGYAGSTPISVFIQQDGPAATILPKT